MAKKLTHWQRLARIARKYGVRYRGFGADEIAEALLKNKRVSDDDKQRIEVIVKKRAENNTL